MNPQRAAFADARNEEYDPLRSRGMTRAILGGILVGLALGLLDCLLQHMRGTLIHPAWWQWSELLLLVPLILAVFAAIKPRSLRVALFIAVVPAPFMVFSYTVRGVANHSTLDAAFCRYACKLGLGYAIAVGAVCFPVGLLSWCLWHYRRGTIGGTGEEPG
jgi:hypothetical protein